MKGQVAIIVLLVSAVMLTMGLSLSKRATVEIRINSDEELLKKAFNAAESGIDYYLGTGNTGYASPDSLSTANVTVTTFGEGSTINPDEYVPAGNRDLYWLVDHNSDGSLGTDYYDGTGIDVCGLGYSGSVAVDYFYKNGATYSLQRYKFDTINTGVCGRVNTGVASGFNPLLLSITPITSGGKFFIQGIGGGDFSSQGVDISSIGRAGGIESGVSQILVNKTVKIRRRYEVPSFMLSGMVAEGSILSD